MRILQVIMSFVMGLVSIRAQAQEVDSKSEECWIRKIQDSVEVKGRSERAYKMIQCTNEIVLNKTFHSYLSPTNKGGIGLLFMAPRCPNNYSLKYFIGRRYMKLRCKRQYGFKKQGSPLWIDIEASLNGRRLIWEKEKPRCLDGWKVVTKIVESIPQFFCKSPGREPEYNKPDWISNPQIRTPECEEGWILKDVLRAGWIQIKCYKKSQSPSKTCTEFNSTYRENAPKSSCILPAVSSPSKRICLLAQPSTKKGRVHCLKPIQVKGVKICLLKIISEESSREGLCTSKKLIFPRGHCIRRTSGICTKRRILIPTIYCKRRLIDQSDRPCLEEGVYFGNNKNLEYRIIKDESKREIELCEVQ